MDHSVRKFVDFYIFPIETIRLSFSENSIGFFFVFFFPLILSVFQAIFLIRLKIGFCEIFQSDNRIVTLPSQTDASVL